MRINKLLLAACILISGIHLNAQEIKRNVTITATIKGMKQGKWIYCSPHTNRTLDSVETSLDGFTLHLTIPPGQGDLYSFYMEKNKFTPGNFMQIYLEPSYHLIISGDNGDFSNVRFSGIGRGIKELNEYRNLTTGWMLHMPSSATDTAASLVLVREAQSKVKLWVRKHPSSQLSATLLFYNRTADMVNKSDTLEKYASMLTTDAKNNYPGRQLETLLTTLKESNIQGSITKLDTLTELAIGKQAPDFTQADTSGRPVSLSDFRGKYVLLNFWGSWCHYCRLENPQIIKGFEKYKDKNFTVVSVGAENSLDKWIKAIHQDRIGRWPQLSDLRQSGNAVSKLYKVAAYPTSFLIGPDGTLLFRGLGSEAADSIFHQMLPNLLN